MKILASAFRVIIKRPYILWFFSIFALILSAADYYNPITPILMGLGNMGADDTNSAIISLLQFLFDPTVILAVLMLILALAAIIALLGGVLLSGYLFISNNAVCGKKSFKGEFFRGVGRYFPNIALMLFLTVIVSFIVIIFMMVASVPAEIVSKAASPDSLKALLSSSFIGILTVAVIYFLAQFFRIYLFFWYAATINGTKKAISIGKRVADRAFWKSFGVLFIFDVVFLIFQIVFFNMSTNIIVIPIKWIFMTFFFPLLVVTFLLLYRQYSSNQNRQ